MIVLHSKMYLFTIRGLWDDCLCWEVTTPKSNAVLQCRLQTNTSIDTIVFLVGGYWRFLSQTIFRYEISSTLVEPYEHASQSFSIADRLDGHIRKNGRIWRRARGRILHSSPPRNAYYYYYYSNLITRRVILNAVNVRTRPFIGMWKNLRQRSKTTRLLCLLLF